MLVPFLPLCTLQGRSAQRRSSAQAAAGPSELEQGLHLFVVHESKSSVPSSPAASQQSKITFRSAIDGATRGARTTRYLLPSSQPLLFLLRCVASAKFHLQSIL